MVKIPLFPSYFDTQLLMKCLNGKEELPYKSMIITLINGDKLIDLLVENEIAVKRKDLEYFTVEPDYFVEDDEEVE